MGRVGRGDSRDEPIGEGSELLGKENEPPEKQNEPLEKQSEPLEKENEPLGVGIYQLATEYDIICAVLSRWD